MHQVSVGYPSMHKAPVFLYVYNSTLWLALPKQKKKEEEIFLGGMVKMEILAW